MLRQTLGSALIARIQHFGSTAVPGLAAKPVIDLLMGVTSLEVAKRTAIAPLQTLNYSYWADNPDPARLFFVKNLPRPDIPGSGPRTHHLHMVEARSPLWERLRFRDYLRQHPEERDRYAQLKRQLAEQFRSDREAYTQAKTDYINSVMQKA